MLIPSTIGRVVDVTLSLNSFTHHRLHPTTDSSHHRSIFNPVKVAKKQPFSTPMASSGVSGYTVNKDSWKRIETVSVLINFLCTLHLFHIVNVEPLALITFRSIFHLVFFSFPV